MRRRPGAPHPIMSGVCICELRKVLRHPVILLRRLHLQNNATPDVTRLRESTMTNDGSAYAVVAQACYVSGQPQFSTHTFLSTGSIASPPAEAPSGTASSRFVPSERSKRKRWLPAATQIEPNPILVS
jgi:hypothetical protein